MIEKRPAAQRIPCAQSDQRSKLISYVMTGRPHPLISRAACATTRPAGSPIDVSRALPPVRQLLISSLSLACAPCPCPHNCYFSFFLKQATSKLRATSKSRQTTSEDVRAFFIYADNEYSNLFRCSRYQMCSGFQQIRSERDILCYDLL